MLQLFLQKPSPSSGDYDGVTGGNRDAVDATLSLLRDLESALWSVISSSGRFESRLWLCNTVASFHSVAPKDHVHLFLGLLRSERSKQDVAPRLLQMIFEKRPRALGRILAKNCRLLENFFRGNPRRVVLWFDNFAGVGESGHRKGARALSLYAFANREVCWEELEWKGKHGQSPAVVATKPHYFQDLDILQTVENFLKYVPAFWSSDELAESVKDGDILKIDTKYFVDQFVRLMYEEDLQDIWETIEEFTLEDNFSSLSQNLLVLLDEDRLLIFFKSIRRYIHLNVHCKNFGQPCCWLENLLSTSSDQISLDELILLNAVIAKGRQLLRLLAYEEDEEVKGKIDALLQNKLSLSGPDHWVLIKESVNMKQQVATKICGLLSWVLYYYLSKDCMTTQSLEMVFSTNGIKFRKSDEYSLVQADESEEGLDLDSDVDGWVSSCKRKRKSERKKKKKHYRRHSSPDEVEDKKTKKHYRRHSSPDEVEDKKTNRSQDLHSGSSWFLSTDDFSCAWNIADLPEYLSRHCFKTWMKWIFSKQ